MYDEDMPSFLSLDPASQYNPTSFLHDPQQLNLYSYARGNPVRYNDPSGEALSDYIEGTPGPGGKYPLGAIQGTYLGVPIYSNGGIYDAQLNEHQCTRFTERFVDEYLGVKLYLGHGKEWGNQANYNTKMQGQLGSFTVYPNGGTELPRENDIIAWSNSQNPYGHVGIVVQTDFNHSTGKGTVWTAEQNTMATGGLYKQSITSSTAGGKITYIIANAGKNKQLTPVGFARYTPATSSKPKTQQQTIQQSKSSGFLSKTLSKIKSWFKK